MKPTARLLPLLCTLVTLTAGCSSSGSKSSGASGPETWNAPTTYRFATLDKRAAPKVEAVFQSNKVLYRRTAESPLAYEITPLRGPNQVARLNRELAEATGQKFDAATINFAALDPIDTGYSNINIKVTPGAEAFVADGPTSGATPWRRVFVDKAGAWSGLVNAKGTVKKQGGWLYVAARKDNLTRYSRVNITTRAAEALTYDRFKASNLPMPSAAGRSAVETAESSKDSGFKWPWE